MYSHPKRIQINVNDKKTELPIHVIIDTSEYTQIMTKQNISIGKRGEPFTEYAAYGWTLISGGREATEHPTLST